MVAKCANPSCDAPFRYLNQGKLFQVERRGAKGVSPTGHNVEHYWLCTGCAQQFTLTRDADGVVAVVPSHPRAA
jgi:hypothetical protein